ncbi:MAG TPA: SAM-dependent methyltransferase, partial [Clostridia bacterium]
MKLPEDFLAKMSKLLSEGEFEEFLSSYKEPRHYGLRVNTLKIALHEFCEISPFAISPVPWTSDGFYYSVEESPGRHPYYHAGLYYIQEP